VRESRVVWTSGDCDVASGLKECGDPSQDVQDACNAEYQARASRRKASGSDVRSLFADVACRAPPRVQYSPWFVFSFFPDTGAILREPRIHPVRVIGFHATAAGFRASVSYQIRPPAFLIRIQ